MKTCEKCNATGLQEKNHLGRMILVEPDGGRHYCPDEVAKNRAYAKASAVTREAIERENRMADTTGNRIARWRWCGGPTGDVEPY